MTGEEIHSMTLTFSVNVEKEEENGEPTEAGGGSGSCEGFSGDKQKDAEQFYFFFICVSAFCKVLL